MSRGPGELGRAILAHLQRQDRFPLLDFLRQHYGHEPTAPEYNSGNRAAHLLAKRGACQLAKERAPQLRGRYRSRPQTFVCQPEILSVGVVPLSEEESRASQAISSPQHFSGSRRPSESDGEFDNWDQKLVVAHYAFLNSAGWAKAGAGYRYVHEGGLDDFPSEDFDDVEDVEAARSATAAMLEDWDENADDPDEQQPTKETN